MDPMDEQGENILLEENYYQLLNISKTAAPEEINSAYRRFSRIFHPDKHANDPGRQKWAEQIFNKVKQAYEVLSDPHRRAIYDTLGKKGLEVEGWEVIVRTKTPTEIREEYERLKAQREEQRLQQSTNPRGNITMSVNATDLFNKYHDYDEYEMEDVRLLPSIEVSGMSIQQSVDTPVTLSDTIRLSGNISTQNGIGSGAVNLSNRRLTSEKGWAELEVGIGNGPSLGLKMFRTMSRVMFLSGGTVLAFTSRGITPSLVSTLALQLDSQSVGYLSYRVGGSSSSLTSSYVRDTPSHHMSAAVQLGNPHSFLSISFMKKMPEQQMKLRFSLKLGTFGAVGEYGAEKKVSQHSSVSAAVMLGIPTGVMLKIKWTRASQSIVVPVHLCEEVIPAPVFYATIVPVVGWLVMKKLFLDPIAKGQADRERQRTRDANFNRIQEMQREARATVELMQATYSRIRAEETKKKGLVILHAFYGKLQPDEKHHPLPADEVDDTTNGEASQPPVTSPNAEVIDVTVPLQCLVKNSKLELLEASKSGLAGFYDPCLGEPKFLTINYLFHNHQHLCTVMDTELVVLPRQAHRIKSRS